MTHPVVFVVGPTGVGKSDFALQAAEQFKGVIVNGDSVQAYQRLDIGTAKPTAQEQKKVPHFLFDIIEPGGYLTAGDYRRLALEILAAQVSVHPAFVVGGSGFYIQALEKGMFDVPKPNPEIEFKVREDYQKMGLSALWQELQRADPEYSEEISPNDSYRILRALVVVREKGIKVSDLRKQFKPQPFPYPLIKIGFECSREKLKKRIQMRTEKMLKLGLLAEVEALIGDGFADWPPMMSVGYRECVQVLKGDLPRDQLAGQIVEKTMQLAKKQMTWFRRDKTITWFAAGSDPAPALKWLSESLSSSGI